MANFFDPITRRFFNEKGEGLLEWLPLTGDDKIPHNLTKKSWNDLAQQVAAVAGKGWKVTPGVQVESSWTNGPGADALTVFGPEQTFSIQKPATKDENGQPVQGAIHMVPVYEVGKHYDFGGVEGLKFWLTSLG